MTCSPLILAEGASLDRLINLVLLVFGVTALPGLIGFIVLLAGRFRAPTASAALILGLLSVFPAGFCFGWTCWEHGSAREFYLASGLPLLLGLVTCVLAWWSRQRLVLATHATTSRVELR